MKKSKVPSPARSTGGVSSRKKITLKRHAHSVDSPGHNTSTHVSAAESGQSLLSDNTSIEQAACKSWWKKLGEDSCNIMLMDRPDEENDESVSVTGSKVLDLIGLEELSQGSIKRTVLETDTSDGELPSIVVPQRKLFKQQINAPQGKFNEIFENNKDILLSTQQTLESNIDLDIQVQPKKLFEQATKPRSKPVFPTELLSITANKTVELPELKLKRKVGELFGNKAATKRKNVFADCFASDSNDELPEVQARIFGFNKQPGHNLIARTSTNIRLSSSFNVNDWKELASSTIIENQTGRISLVSRRLSQFSDDNHSIDKSKSRISRNKSKSIQETCLNQHNTCKELDKSSDRTLTNESISEEAPSLNQHSHIKNVDEENTLVGDISINIEHQIDNNISVDSITMDKEKLNVSAKNISINKVTENKEVATDSNNKNQQEHNTSNKQNIQNVKNRKTDTEEPYENSNILAQKDNQHENYPSEVQDKSQIGTLVMDDDNQENNKIEELNATETEKQNVTEEINASYTENQVASETEVASEIEQQDDSETETVTSETEEVSSITEVASETEEQDANEKEEVDSVIKQDASDIEIVSEAEEPEDVAVKIVEQTANEMDEINATETEDRNDNLVERNDIENESDNKENKNRIEDEHSRKQINKEAMSTPELVLHDKTKHIADSIVAKRYTSLSKTLYNTLKLRPSSIPLRESTGLSDGTNDSSANRSGWDSHRTTRKTLRQTFGKDFTPRKSLRTLVMEKSAKRQTQFNQDQRQAEVMDTADEVQTNIEEKDNLANNIVAEEQANCERIDDTHENLGILDKIDSNSKSKDKTLENLDIENSITLNKTHENSKSNNETLVNSRTLNKTHENSKIKIGSLENSRTLGKTPQYSKSKDKTLENSRTLNKTQENSKSKNETLENSRTLDKTYENSKSKNNSKALDKTHNISKSKNRPVESLKSLNSQKNSSTREKSQENITKSPDNSKRQTTLSELCETTNSTAHFVTIDETYENSSTMDNTPANSRLTKTVNDIRKEKKLSEFYEATNYETIDETHENSRTLDKRSENMRNENQLLANDKALNSQRSSKFFDNTRTYNETVNNTEFTIANDIPLAYSTSYNHYSTTYNASVTRGDETEEYLKIINEDDETYENSENINKDDEPHEDSKNINDETNEHSEHIDEDDIPHENTENINDDEINEHSDEDDDKHENSENINDEINEHSEHIDEDDETHENSVKIGKDVERQENTEATNEVDEDVNDEDDESDDNSEIMDEDDGTHDNSEIMDKTQSNSKIQAYSEINNAENTIVNKVPLAYSTPYVNIPPDEPSIEQDESMEQSLDEAAFEMAMKKIREDKITTKRKIEEDIQNCQKRTKFSFFKVPQAPVRLRPIQSKPKPKPRNPVGYDLLPASDLIYKPPKKYKPNASWVTKRLYKFLEDKLRPKYDYKARVRAEKFVETLYNFTKDIRRHHPAAPHHIVHALKLEMARLNIVTTHYDFYDFFYEYMPREIRTKVNPDIVNCIPLPREGGFSNIIS